MFTLISFLFFTGLVAFVSWRMTRKDDHESASGYFLAGRSLSWAFIAGSLLLTNLSTEQLVGLNGGAFKHGMQVMFWELGGGMAMIAMALIFLPRYLKGGVTTVPQYLEKRYDSTVRMIISVLLLLSLLTNLLPFVLYSGALFMVEVFGVPKAFGISQVGALWIVTVAIGVVGAIYAIWGGLKAVAVSDTLNGLGLLIGGLMIPILGLMKLGNGSLMEGLNVLSTNHVKQLDPIGPPDGNIPFATLFTGMIFINLYYWCTNQAIVQRTFGAKSLEQGQKGVIFASFMKMFGPFYLVLPGIIAFHLYGANGLDNADNAYGRLISDLLPAWMIGFFCAVIFGAVLSSFNSGLNSATTLFSMDVYKNWWNKDAEEAELVAIGKRFGIVIAIGAIGVAPFIANFSGGLFDLMKQLAALFNVPLITITIIGIFFPRVPALGAKLAIATGVIFYGYFGLWCGNTVFGIELNWLHLAGLNGAICVLVMLIVGSLQPLEKPFKLQASNDVDLTPWPWAGKACVGILGIVIFLYVWLHTISLRNLGG
ncbi:MAG: solute:sodium symporter family transporter [Verrucomicrobiales bacterium]|nr:solute:sodium symporter family transporter [Verrucomicrobiales bacterium]|tara:strand:+ start:931 stop:2544 length:1614 start_codon:yes stop_codon:yes gene_type:complete